jgi:hypothetical protein
MCEAEARFGACGFGLRRKLPLSFPTYCPATPLSKNLVPHGGTISFPHAEPSLKGDQPEGTLRLAQRGGPMSFAVEVVQEDRLVRAKLYGESDVDEVRATVAEIKSRVGSSPVEGVLIDVRDVHYAPTPDEAQNLGADFFSFLGRRRLAIVTRSLVHYKMARTISLQAVPRGMQVGVFQDEHDALDWLHSPDTSHERYELPGDVPVEGPSQQPPNEGVAGTTGRNEQ